MKRKSKQQRVRRCPDCGERHTRAEGCSYEDDDICLEPEDEAFGLGAFIGSLMAGLSAFAERQRRRQQQRVEYPALRPANVNDPDPDVMDVEYEVIEDETKSKGATTHDATRE